MGIGAFVMHKKNPIGYLKELAAIHDLSNVKVAAIVGVSTRTLDYWFTGETTPLRSHARMIDEAIDKIEATYPEPKMEKLPSGAEVSAASWSTPEDDELAIAEDKGVHEPLKKVFASLMEKTGPAERAIIVRGWTDFVEIFASIKRHQIEIK
jgi:hypothetical protein